MDKESLNNHANIILDLSQKISNYLSYIYKFDKTELNDFCNMYIIENCGDIVYNLDYDINLMKACIYNKAKKRAIGYIISNKEYIDLESVVNSRLESKDNEKETEKLDLSQWNLDERHKNILQMVSMYLEMGYENKEAFNEVAKTLQIDIEELMYEVEVIKENILISKDKEYGEEL